MNAINETELPPDVRRGLEQLRACDNVLSVTVLELTAAGAHCILVPVPTDDAIEPGAWGRPTEPTLFLIPTRPN